MAWCGVQGDSFVASLSACPLLAESDVLTVLDLSENAIGDNGAAALAAAAAAAGQAAWPSKHPGLACPCHATRVGLSSCGRISISSANLTAGWQQFELWHVHAGGRSVRVG